MRRCVNHGNESNCANFVVGPCSGIINEATWNPEEAAQRLADFAGIVGTSDEDARAQARDWLLESGAPPDEVDAMLESDSSPFNSRRTANSSDHH